jgi:hypothetical protein
MTLKIAGLKEIAAQNRNPQKVETPKKQQDAPAPAPPTKKRFQLSKKQKS